MDNFRARLAGLVAQRFDTVPERLTLSEQAVTDILLVIQGAIENAGVSPEIDAWIVRTGLGKQGSRVNAIQSGDKRIETVDRFSEIYCRVYETERRCNMGPVEAANAADRVLKSLLEQGAFDGQK